MSRPILQDLGWWISHLDDFEYQHLQRFGHPCRATPTSADKHQPHLLRKSWWSTTSAPRAGSRAAVDLNAGENQIDRIWQVIGPWTIIYIYILPESNIWWWNMVLGEIAVTSSQFSPFFTKQPQGHFFLRATAARYYTQVKRLGRQIWLDTRIQCDRLKHVRSNSWSHSRPTRGGFRGALIQSHLAEPRNVHVPHMVPVPIPPPPRQVITRHGSRVRKFGCGLSH